MQTIKFCRGKASDKENTPYQVLKFAQKINIKIVCTIISIVIFRFVFVSVSSKMLFKMKNRNNAAKTYKNCGRKKVIMNVSNVAATAFLPLPTLIYRIIKKRNQTVQLNENDSVKTHPSQPQTAGEAPYKKTRTIRK